jgi:hypothetical protein
MYSTVLYPIYCWQCFGQLKLFLTAQVASLMYFTEKEASHWTFVDAFW